MEARQRKKKPNESPSSGGKSSLSQKETKKKVTIKDDRQPKSTEAAVNDEDSVTVDDLLSIGKWLSYVIGLCLMVYAGRWFTIYTRTLHENQMWFTNIQEVEREISLRTECGLYYSYYKQLIASPSLAQGVIDLTRDNTTEHSKTINILQRFNIYPELFLAFVYRLSPDYWANATGGPIFFYIYAIFALNGFFISVLFATTWKISGSWLAGVLTAVFYVVNLEDATRVHYSNNLRESFALPFFFLQAYAICLFLRRGSNGSLWGPQLLIFLSTLLFSLSWQFNQFFLLLQGFVLYGMGIALLAPRLKICRILMLNLAALFVCCLLQMMEPMLLGCLFFSFAPAAIFSLYLFRNCTISGGIDGGCMKLVLQFIFTLILAVPLNLVVKRLLNIEADQHILKFLKGKFGFADSRDFESRLYLCHGAFAFLESDFFVRTSIDGHGLFPIYLLMLSGGLFVMGKDILMEWCSPIVPLIRRSGTDASDKPFCFNRRPEVAFLILQSALFGLVSMMALRIRYVWVPHMCILAAVLVADRQFWHYMYQLVAGEHRIRTKTWVADAFRHTLTLFILSHMVWKFIPKYNNQLGELREFWDPDTVELMYWIGNNTRTTDSFAGSMQLLAGVKCCTGRHITNHPHFENKDLRDRTLQIYQMYGRQHPEYVHGRLRAYDTKYIILEDSICLARSDGCRTPDLVDLANGHAPDFLMDNGNGESNKWTPPGLKKTTVPRFCDEIRHQQTPYKKYFKLVMHNRTFRVYEVL